MTAAEEVQKAHEVFYAALNRIVRSDGSQMPNAWWHDDEVTTTHPMGGWAIGWEPVMATWDELSRTLSEGNVDVTDLNIFVRGDIAYTVGVEHVRFTVFGRQVQFKANTTNVYARRDGQWKMIHHHPDKAPAAEDAIAGG